MAITWHPQLADKGAKIRNRLYHAIDDSGGKKGTELRRIIYSCLPHFQDNPFYTIKKQRRGLNIVA